MTLPNGVATLPNGLVPSILPPPRAWVPGQTVLDIGAGLRPMPWNVPERHICAEPHGPYADRLEAAGYEVWRLTAGQALFKASIRLAGKLDAIYLLDVIEHMNQAEGEIVIEHALALNPRQIVVFTPNGFWPQEGDAWGLGGEEWQRHRSGWTPDDFPGWAIEQWSEQQFFATWTRP